MRPAPAAVAGARPPSSVAGRAVVTSAERVCAGDHVGCNWVNIAATPATCGVAIEAPETTANGLREKADRTCTPRAAPPGRISSGVVCAGPGDEKPATSSGSQATAVAAV